MHEEVISDTTPIQYLHQAGCLDLLPALYSSIIVPEGVAAELAVGHAQGVSLPDLDRLDWVRIRTAPHLDILPLAADLGQGEREVLSLAAGRSDVLALLDDGLARHFARHLEISFTGCRRSSESAGFWLSDRAFALNGADHPVMFLR